jgi:hypothetical protein
MSSDPYWAPPETEAPRFERIESAIRGNKEYKGIAAYGRNPDNVVLVIGKSANDNAVLWEYVNAGNSGPQIIAYWLAVEPSTREEQRAKGNESMISKLSAIEETLCGAQIDARAGANGSMRYFVSIRAEQLKDRIMELLRDKDGTPFLGGTLNGRRARVESAYMQLRRGLTPSGLFSPSAIEDIRVSGTDVASGATFGQRVTESLQETLALASKKR